MSKFKTGTFENKHGTYFFAMQCTPLKWRWLKRVGVFNVYLGGIRRMHECTVCKNFISIRYLRQLFTSVDFHERRTIYIKSETY